MVVFIWTNFFTLADTFILKTLRSKIIFISLIFSSFFSWGQTFYSPEDSLEKYIINHATLVKEKGAVKVFTTPKEVYIAGEYSKEIDLTWESNGHRFHFFKGKNLDDFYLFQKNLHHNISPKKSTSQNIFFEFKNQERVNFYLNGHRIQKNTSTVKVIITPYHEVFIGHKNYWLSRIGDHLYTKEEITSPCRNTQATNDLTNSRQYQKVIDHTSEEVKKRLKEVRVQTSPRLCFLALSLEKKKLNYHLFHFTQQVSGYYFFGNEEVIQRSEFFYFPATIFTPAKCEIFINQNDLNDEIYYDNLARCLYYHKEPLSPFSIKNFSLDLLSQTFTQALLEDHYYGKRFLNQESSPINEDYICLLKKEGFLGQNFYPEISCP